MTESEHTENLSQLFAQEFQDLQKTAELRSYPAETVIFSEGDPSNGFFHLEEGEVEISAQISDDDRRVFARIAPGEIFGEMAVLDDGPRSATATASIDSKIYFFSSGELFRILQGNPEAMIRLLRYLSRRIRSSNQQYIEEVIQAEKLSIIGRFARNIVHDFKNPLNIIGLATEMATAKWSDEKSRLNSLERIERQARRMNNMLNELLEFSHGDAQQLGKHTQDYPQYVRDLLNDTKLDLIEKKIDIIIDCHPTNIELAFDPRRISHLLFNLVNNAADEMSRGGTITITISSSDESVTTQIEDTGPGIAPEIVAKLFEPFATHGKSHGTGLGLSICKKIVLDHGGKIWADPNAPGGARFIFTLPGGTA